MLINLLLGFLTMTLCLLLQSVLLVSAMRYYLSHERLLNSPSMATSLLVVNVVMFLLVLGNLGQVAVWAILFQVLGEFQVFPEAYYHSAVNFATLGYGDIVMSDEHRIKRFHRAGDRGSEPAGLFPVTRNSSNLREEDKRRLLFKTGSVAMNFGEFQEVVDQWIQGHGRYWSKFEIVARLIEDLGEISRTLQHTEGLRTGKDELKVADDIGDLLFTLAAFANANGLRLEDCVDGVMEKYRTRESTEW